MVDSQRTKRMYNTVSSVKRQQKRRLSAVTYYSNPRDIKFGALFQLIRFWKKQAKNNKQTLKTHLEPTEMLSKTQQPHTISFVDVDQTKADEKPVIKSNNLFRVKFTSHCGNLKPYSLRKASQSKIMQLSVFSKTINNRAEKTNKNTDIVPNSGDKLQSIRVPCLKKPIKLKKEVFLEEQKLTPW